MTPSGRSSVSRRMHHTADSNPSTSSSSPSVAHLSLVVAVRCVILLLVCVSSNAPFPSCSAESQTAVGGRAQRRPPAGRNSSQTMTSASSSSSLLPPSQQQQQQQQPANRRKSSSSGRSSSFRDFGRTDSGAECVEIPADMRLCRNVGYSLMRLPNLLDHDSINEARQQSSAWIHLRDINCHPYTQLFLCSLFAPVCVDRPIWPCRSLCLAVKSGCEVRMKFYGFVWPEMLQCDRFPRDDDLCISMQSVVQTPSPEDAKCHICKPTDTLAAIVDQFCNSEFAMQVGIDQVSVAIDDDLKVTVAAKKKSVFRTGNLTRKELRSPAVMHIRNGATCRCTRKLISLSSSKSQQSQSAASNDTYLVMGHRETNGSLTVTFIRKIDRKSADMQNALRAIVNDTDCRNVSQSIETPPVTSATTTASTRVVRPVTSATTVSKPDRRKHTNKAGKRNRPTAVTSGVEHVATPPTHRRVALTTTPTPMTSSVAISVGGGGARPRQKSGKSTTTTATMTQMSVDVTSPGQSSQSNRKSSNSSSSSSSSSSSGRDRDRKSTTPFSSVTTKPLSGKRRPS